MTSSVAEIAKRILELPRQQRVALIRLLLDLDQPATRKEVDGAWDAEIRARVKAIDEGRAVAVPYERIRSKWHGDFLGDERSSFVLKFNTAV